MNAQLGHAALLPDECSAVVSSEMMGLRMVYFASPSRACDLTTNKQVPDRHAAQRRVGLGELATLELVLGAVPVAPHRYAELCPDLCESLTCEVIRADGRHALRLAIELQPHEAAHRL